MNNSNSPSKKSDSSEYSSDCSNFINLKNDNIDFCKICDPKNKYNNCICDKNWKKFNDILNDINNINSDDILMPFRISTITLCFYLNSNIDTLELSKKYICKNNGKFYNSFTFNWTTKYQHKNIVSVKLFPNGKVQVTGLSSIMSCAYIIRKVYNKCKKFMLSEKGYISHVKIAMINSDFKLNNCLNLFEVCSHLSENNIQSNGNFLSIVYQPVKYPAINSKFICDKYIENYLEHYYKHNLKKKFSEKLSILIFRSGSIIITGGNKIEDYLFAYNYMIKLFNNNKYLFVKN